MNEIESIELELTEEGVDAAKEFLSHYLMVVFYDQNLFLYHDDMPSMFEYLKEKDFKDMLFITEYCKNHGIQMYLSYQKGFHPIRKIAWKNNMDYFQKKGVLMENKKVLKMIELFNKFSPTKIKTCANK